MDFEQARFNMVEQQIRTWDVLDQDVLDLLFEVRREDFVPPAYRTLAFADLEIPLGEGERMWTPKMEARVLQELELERSEAVLEIGTGSGYLTALLARSCRAVTSVEINARLFGRSARASSPAPASSTSRLEVGDGARGWGERALRRDRADRIDAGPARLVAAAAEARRPSVRRRRRSAGDDCARWCAGRRRARSSTEDLFETVIAPLRNAAQPARFVF